LEELPPVANALILQEVAEELALFGLRNPYLRVLEGAPALVQFLLVQPQAVVVADATRVGVRDHALLTLQMKGFLRKALEGRVDVALSPEYSCTWPALLESVEADVFPEDGKLWVIACESATREQLEAAITRFEQCGHVVAFDPTVWTTDGNYIDAICYLFRTRRLNGQPVGAVLIQCKTHAMGGDRFEYKYLKTGHKIYRFRNAEDHSGSLVAFICSDTLHPEFNDKIVPQLKYNTFVLHPQMNPNPTNPGFCAYRGNCCFYHPRTTEVLALNWATGTLLEHDGKDSDFIVEPKSIWLRDLTGLKLDDAPIMANHDRGCYLTHWNQHTAAYLFSPDPHLFLLQTTKPFVSGPATNALRSGPEMLQLLGWGATSPAWTMVKADDRFGVTWHDPYPETQPILGTLLTSRYLDAERLIQLSVGQANDINWTDWNRQPSFKLASDDTACRLTVCRSNDGDGPKYRTQCLANFRGFAKVVGAPTKFSIRLVEFKAGGFKVDHSTKLLHLRMRNLYRGDAMATGIFAGFAPPAEILLEVKKKTLRALDETGSDREMLAIWYLEADGELKDYMDQTIPKATDDPNAGPVAFDNTVP
jgi:hypothetical protein